MNYNIIGYCIYLAFIFTVIIKVGLICYHQGKVWCLQLFNGDEELTLRTNNILLLSYYLFNLGYCLVTIQTWHKLYSLKECIESISNKAGSILIIIAILHLINIAVIGYIANRQQDKDAGILNHESNSSSLNHKS